ncbi:MAG: DNA-directed RNA polymerase subunit beta' [Patescibacteria group bacterium]
MPTPSTTKTTFLDNEMKAALDFDSIRLRVASPTTIHDWSHGEVTKPETINYRTQKPERDGLFCQRIFGPVKDWECSCGKYKRIRYKGIICDKCGVEVTRASVRRERMGHIDLAAPVSHIWFLRNIPSKIGLMLDMSIQDLEKVIYFASFIITEVNEELRDSTIAQIKDELKQKQKQMKNEHDQAVKNAEKHKSQALAEDGADKKAIQKEADKHEKALKEQYEKKQEELKNAADTALKELASLEIKQILSEVAFQDLSIKYGHVFTASIGAEAVYELLKMINVEVLADSLEKEITKTSGARKKKLFKRLQLVKSFIKNDAKPEWMVMTAIPVIPPDLRPMVALDGGRYATSDLNDLYRRVINRNNRLKRLIDLNAPEVIQRNEKRMLQEAVDALIDNSARQGKTVTASTGQKRQLKSIADMLKGKQGRFRQNLLGKRVDYSGRSVIVAGPHLQMHQCGLPKIMALELFKPFVISELIKREIVHNVRSANRYIEAGHTEVYDILEEITEHAHVMLNRAPTLHRLGIQAFQPVLIEGKAIQLHPLVCTAFNADFDGDQMAVHVPLTKEAKREAEEIILSTRNLLSPATGDPIVAPSQDIVWGAFYLTILNHQPSEAEEKELKHYTSQDEAILAYELGYLKLQDPVKVRYNDELIVTSAGRLLFNRVIPDEVGFYNEPVGKKKLRQITAGCIHVLGMEEAARVLDEIKEMTYEYITQSGLSWGMGDLFVAEEKIQLIEEAEAKVDSVLEQYEMGLLTDRERKIKVIEIWTETKDKVTEATKKQIDPHNPAMLMIDSGARGSWGQLTQAIGMRGLVSNPSGDIIELPVKSNLTEGSDVLEYFISTHGARKGLSDTALKTANAGYLTRRLVDVAQDIIISEIDCGDTEGIRLLASDAGEMGQELADRVYGRVTLDDIKTSRGKVLAKKGEFVTKEQAEQIREAGVEEARVRSVRSCTSVRGLCQKCYGYDLAKNEPAHLGSSVGIIAAQSIGEPGTQLTMRTFHTGGVAGESDVTQGLPRVEELFEARNPKKVAFVADARGKIKIKREDNHNHVTIVFDDEQRQTYDLEELGSVKLKVEDGDAVVQGDTLFSTSDKKFKATFPGVIALKKDKELSVVGKKGDTQEYIIPLSFGLKVAEGDLVNPGDVLTDGSVNLRDLFELSGRDAVERYILKEIQTIYSSQGQKLNDRHVEIIIRQMFSRVMVKDSGDTTLLPGDVIERSSFLEANNELKKSQKPAKAEELLLGITKSSLSTDSWLAAASFQETAKVLINAAVTGKVDTLKGLKENVIIGRLIPAGTGYDVEE